MPDVYRGKYRDTDYSPEELVDLYTDEIKNIVDTNVANGRGISCFIGESLQSCGGQIILPPNYLKKAYKCAHFCKAPHYSFNNSVTFPYAFWIDNYNLMWLAIDISSLLFIW